MRLLSIFILIAFFHLLFYKSGLYAMYEWLDMPMHFSGGAFLALAWIYFLRRVRIISMKKTLDVVHALALIGFVLLGGIAWEIFEYVSWRYLSDVVRYFALYDPFVGDVLGDLTLDFLGGIVVLWGWRFVQKRSQKKDD